MPSRLFTRPRPPARPAVPVLVAIEAATTHYRITPDRRVLRDCYARFSDGTLRMVALVDGPDL